jgi:AcrR family transcriptional regulator
MEGAGEGAPAEGRSVVRERIVRGARRLLEDRGVEISAPAVYHHFPDLRAVLEAVIGDAYRDHAAVTFDAVADLEDPRERLRVGALAYLRFAREHPATYRILFSRHRPSALPEVAAHAAANHQLLVDTIAECRSFGRPAEADAAADAVSWWCALHGAADLPSAHPRFPWPSAQEMVDHLLRRIALRDPRG